MATRDTGSRPWYAEGLRFRCDPDCGACCTNHEDYAYLYLEGDDAERLAAHLSLPLETFKSRYTFEEEGHLALNMDAPDCPFLDGTLCGVYEARPVQCRTFPFWRENLARPRDWKRLRRFCPGIDEGETHGLEVIRRRLAERRT